MEIRGPRIEVRGLRIEIRGPEFEDRRQRSGTIFLVQSKQGGHGYDQRGNPTFHISDCQHAEVE